jgi:hypothetical protein
LPRPCLDWPVFVTSTIQLAWLNHWRIREVSPTGRRCRKRAVSVKPSSAWARLRWLSKPVKRREHHFVKIWTWENA